jgi:hypothetical protein
MKYGSTSILSSPQVKAESVVVNSSQHAAQTRKALMPLLVAEKQDFRSILPPFSEPNDADWIPSLLPLQARNT